MDRQTIESTPTVGHTLRHLWRYVILIVGALMSIIVDKPAHAAGEVAALIQDYTCYNSTPPPLVNTSTPDECYALWQARDGGLHYQFCISHGGTMRYDVSRYPNGQIIATGHVCTYQYGGGYFALFNYYCPSGTAPQQGMCMDKCPVDDLTPLTDPVALDFENGNRWRPDGLTADFQSKLACIQSGISNRGGTYVGTSAYRPTQYQQHLFEIIKKDVFLDTDYMIAHPECQALREEVTRAMGPPPGHDLSYDQPVARPGKSRHESGTAFDVTPSGLTDAQLAPVYTGCGVTHTAVPGEPWHVQ